MLCQYYIVLIYFMYLQDWSRFSVDKREEPDVYLSHSQEDTGYEIFRQLSHKVAGCRYDIPWGSQVVVAYSRTPGIAESAEAIGIITFCLADGKLQHTTVEDDFMSGYFHKVILCLFITWQHCNTG